MPANPKPRGSALSLRTSAQELGGLKDALLALSFLLPERTTLRQTTALAALLWETAMGRRATLSDLVAALGEDVDGKPILGNSPERVMDKFKVPSRKETERLLKLSGDEQAEAYRQRPRGWIDLVENEDDRRFKFLELTQAGTELALRLAACIRGADRSRIV